MTPGGPLVRAGRALGGRFTPPGDKSITHRALLFGLLAEGETRIRGGNPGEDCARSRAAAAALGAKVSDERGETVVRGAGMALRRAEGVIDCGNSGTTLRLLAGIVAGRADECRLDGDASLRRRPMARVIEPLTRMGAAVDSAEGGRPPLRVRGGALRGIAWESPVASAQVATCVLLAGLAAAGPTSVTLPGPARDHTERMLPAFGVPLDVRGTAGGGRTVTIERARPRGTSLAVPGDFSAAAFALAAGAASPGAEVTAAGVNLNPTRTGLLDVLAAMGAGVSVANRREEAGEPVGDVTVRGPERLAPFDVPADWVPRLVDEVPAWAVAASAADGVSRITGAAELRVKESDRLAVLARNLARLGLRVRELPDGLEIEGGVPTGGVVEADLDHRVVMAFAALATRAAGPVTFDDASSVATSYPGFWAELAALGAEVEGIPA
jgi:3-phosphoshikimate 1-carboxyvinyltransferase